MLQMLCLANIRMEGSRGMDVDNTGASQYPTLPPVDEDEEWMYPMRRTMQEIIPGLFLGPYASASKSNLDAMKTAGLTHVVCVRAPCEAHLIGPNHPGHFQYLVMDMEDSALEMVIPKVKAVTGFIDAALNANGKVLVHGNAGMSRSATLVVGYIMSKFGVTFKKASKYVQTKRFCVCVKETFAQQLREYEMIYSAMHSTPTSSSVPGMSGAEFQSLKRTIDEIEDDNDDQGNAAVSARPRMEANERGMEMD